MEKPLPVDWGYSGSYSPDGKSLAFNRHPAVWSRQHYRGSYAADLWTANLASNTYTKLLGDERYNRYWPMWGADDAIYFVADPLPNDKSIKAGSFDVRKSANNIYKIPAKGGQPVQVTKHTDGNVFWPSMSSDGKVIVYEDNFGIWKLDVASGRTSEIKLDIATDEKENQVDVDTVTNEVDAFDISPSGRRAVISARGQILTIATERGDITRLAPDKMASRNDAPKWSSDGKYIAFISDRSGRDEVWISESDSKSPKKITDLDNEKGSLVWTPDSKLLLYTAADKKLYSYSVADGKTTLITSTDLGRLGSVAVSPDSKWVTFSKQDRTVRTHVYIAPIGGGEERHISDDSLLYAENNAVWTADGRYIVFTSSEGTNNGIATQGGLNDHDVAVGAVAAGSGSRSDQPRHRQRSAGRWPRKRLRDRTPAAAVARERRTTGGGSNRLERPGASRKADCRCRGRPSAASPRPPRGTRWHDRIQWRHRRRPRCGAAPDGASGMYIINVESDQQTRVPPAAPSTLAGAGGRGRGGAGGGFGGGSSMVFARDGRTLYFRSGSGLYAATIPANAAGGATGPAAGGGGGGRGGRGGGGAAQRPPRLTSRERTPRHDR